MTNEEFQDRIIAPAKAHLLAEAEVRGIKDPFLVWYSDPNHPDPVLRQTLRMYVSGSDICTYLEIPPNLVGSLAI